MSVHKMDILEIDEQPFNKYQISDKWKLLHTLDNRSVCTKCTKSRKYFCYTCYLPVAEIKDDVPVLEVCLISVLYSQLVYKIDIYQIFIMSVEFNGP